MVDIYLRLKKIRKRGELKKVLKKLNEKERAELSNVLVLISSKSHWKEDLRVVGRISETIEKLRKEGIYFPEPSFYPPPA